MGKIFFLIPFTYTNWRGCTLNLHRHLALYKATELKLNCEAPKGINDTQMQPNNLYLYGQSTVPVHQHCSCKAVTHTVLASISIFHVLSFMFCSNYVPMCITNCSINRSFNHEPITYMERIMSTLECAYLDIIR